MPPSIPCQPIVPPVSPHSSHLACVISSRLVSYCLVSFRLVSSRSGPGLTGGGAVQPTHCFLQSRYALSPVVSRRTNTKPPPNPSKIEQKGISLEEITTHRSLPAIALQAAYALVRRLLARVKVLAVRLAAAKSACFQTSFLPFRCRSLQWGGASKCIRTYRTLRRLGLTSRACRFRRDCLWPCCAG